MRLAHEALMFDDPEDPPRVVPDDPRDDYLVALAEAAGAEALVIGNRHFEKVNIKGIPILSPREFLWSLNFLAR
jgi:predicted nucleic acid-binding protein